MKIYALSDPHLALATPRKGMAVFGDHWVDHAQTIAKAWKERVRESDLVIVPGDISWAMKLETALPDIEFLASLPGRKVLVRGNHDYWWRSLKKIRALLPDGFFLIQNDALNFDGVSLGGARLWIDHEMAPLKLTPRNAVSGGPDKVLDVDLSREGGREESDREQDEKIFQRELHRLELSLSQMEESAALKIAAVHFPPLSTDLKGTRTTEILESAGVDHCVFGHLHNLAPSPGKAFFGCRRGIAYHLASCDYLDFTPALVAEV
ncbi:MAG: metallophosphoesterase [Planctomycetes bacterium]|nr:metallophosphoesterase [Planctomycetota bacterium]